MEQRHKGADDAMSGLAEFLRTKGFDKMEADRTSERWYSWLEENLCRGKGKVKKHFEAITTADYDEVVIVKDIDVSSICPHHLLPVVLKVHIGYLPDGQILGVSKFARVAKDLVRPVMQEEYTQELVDTIYDYLSPRWVMAIVIGQHMCMRCRGVEAINSEMITNCMRHEEKVNPYPLKQEMMKCVA